MLVKLGLTEGPCAEQIQAWAAASASAQAAAAVTNVDGETNTAAGMAAAVVEEEEGEEEETDPDVLSLPPVGALAAHLGLWLPSPLTPRYARLEVPPGCCPGRPTACGCRALSRPGTHIVPAWNCLPLGIQTG